MRGATGEGQSWKRGDSLPQSAKTVPGPGGNGDGVQGGRKYLGLEVRLHGIRGKLSGD